MNKKLIMTSVCFFIYATSQLSACARGDMFEAYHKNNPNPHVYFEDALKAEQKSAQEIEAEVKKEKAKSVK